MPKVTTLDAPALGLGQDLLSDAPSMTELMSLIEQMGLSHLFVSDAFYITLSNLPSSLLPGK